MMSTARVFAALMWMLIFAAPAGAAQCGGDFNAFLSTIGREAQAAGVSRGVIDQALAGITPDASVLAFDRRQRGTFRKSFEDYARTRVIPARINRAKSLMQKNAALLARIEKQFGVPGAVLVAIWGLETDYGVVHGKRSVIRSVATLAYDCRRTDKFQAELTSALRIVDSGDMTSEQMVGEWAGEIGQTQFLPSSYVKYAVNIDGRGRADLVRNASDVLASTANYLKSHGWQRGQGWNHGQPNFVVIQEWNKAEVYAKTIALFADKLGGGRSIKGAENAEPERKAGAKPAHDKSAKR
jgi:lytic murein transglycosylase